MSIIKIKGEDVPSPLPFEVVIADQDFNTDTDSNGTLHRNRIAVKRKLNLEWGLLTWKEISRLLTLTADVFFNVEYPDPQAGIYQIRRFYVGDRTAPVCFQENGDVVWKNLKLNIVEQ